MPRIPSSAFRRRRGGVVAGVDLSPDRLKVVAITRGEDGVRVVAAADEPLGQGGPRRRFDAAEVAERLRAVLARLGLQPDAAGLALGPAEAIARRLTVVEQERPATLAALALQLAPGLGPDVSAPAVDYMALSAARGDRVAVFAAAGRQDAIAAQRLAVEEAGCAVGPVLPAAAAVLNAWLHGRPEDAPERVLLLHVGETVVLWMLLDGGEVAAVDAPLVGVASLHDRGAVRRRAGGEVSGVAAPALDEWIGRIRQEVVRGLSAARRESGAAAGEAVPEVWVSGGGSRVAGLLDGLRSALGAPVHRFDPLPALGADPDQAFGPALVPALGAALQALPGEAEGPLLDLRPASAPAGGADGRVPLPALARRVATDRGFRAAAAAGLLAAALAGAAHLRLRSAEESVSRREARVRLDSAALSAALAKSEAVAARRASMGEALARLRELERGRDLAPRLLAAVQADIPGTAWVAGITGLATDSTVAGTTFRLRGYAAADAGVTEFAARLGRSVPELRTDVAFTRAVEIGSATAVEFELRAEAAGGASGAEVVR